MNISARWCASASPPLEAAVHKRRRFLAAALGSVAAAALPGCYTIHETPPGGVPAAGSRHVMLVERIEVAPRMATGEQDNDIKTALFNTNRYKLDGAVFQRAAL